MPRITKKTLESQLSTLNMLLERPLEQFASKVGEPVRFSTGHIGLLHDSSGYSIEETVSVHGAVHTLGSGLTANEAYYLLRGMISGIALRNAHIGELLLRNELAKSGICRHDHPLYQDDLKAAGRVINHADGSMSVMAK